MVRYAPNGKRYAVGNDPVIHVGRGIYPFADLTRHGDFFEWPDTEKYSTLRVQARRHGIRRGLKYHVKKTASGVRVTLALREI